MTVTFDVVFMGTAPFGFPVMRSLSRDERLNVRGIITQPDRKRGRGQESQSPPVANFARELDLPLYQPEDINDDGLAVLDDLGPLDFGLVIAYGQLLSTEVLNHPERGFFNFHASLLPRWRGAAPIRHALIEGDDRTGVSVFRIREELDAGPVCVTLSLSIRDDETYGSLYERLSQVNVGALNVLISDLEADRLVLEEQTGTVTYAPKIESSDAKIDWEQSAVTLERFIRAFYPDPGAFTTLSGDRFKILRARLAGTAESDTDPGTILKMSKDEMQVATGEGRLALESVQPAGSDRMDVQQYLAGNPEIEVGDRFGR